MKRENTDAAIRTLCAIAAFSILGIYPFGWLWIELDIFYSAVPVLFDAAVLSTLSAVVLTAEKVANWQV